MTVATDLETVAQENQNPNMSDDVSTKRRKVDKPKVDKPEISISSCFDSGNIKVVSARGGEFDLEIMPDPFTAAPDNQTHMQWFHFRASNVLDKECTFQILNAGKCSYPDDFVGYRTCYSYDRERWFRAPTTYSEETGVLKFSICATQDIMWCAYFAPYSYEQHQQLIARCAQSPLAHVRSIGRTLDGRELDLITCGSGTFQAWFIARQHPGEPMAEHFMEGLLNRLLDHEDALARRLRSLFTFHMIPNMNPDGSVRGYLRTNVSGANLNREWCSTGEYEAPTMTRSPEVFLTLKEMDKTGCDFFCDVHGDEGTPHNFFAGTHAMPSWTPRHGKLLETLCEAMHGANPDFGNLLYNYSNDEIGGAPLNSAAEQVAERFGCLSVTLEQPFKDVFDNPEPQCGWSPPRCRRLGASILDALSTVAGDLRRDFKVDESSLPSWAKPGYACPDVVQLSWKAD